MAIKGFRAGMLHLRKVVVHTRSTYIIYATEKKINKNKKFICGKWA